ncbi:leucyl aminopeptidase family protein [Sphingomonas quercus]|uniref:Leucyl aminopeptidase family protein n=1 Tax=Sphingomonas quercus TaxID=2842451 RepID=A0ABS6BDE1_9SPHN|nr:leucyl aminopeptidase family protein [Sphingomonas quercus]MBU3076333.1 leucyl aminopeptidase family protein [Sphingomonas quercus]
MTDFAALLQPDLGQPAHRLHLLRKDDLDGWLRGQPERVRAAVAAQRFEAKPGEFAMLPGDGADDWEAALGLPAKPGPWDIAPAVAKLPAGTYRAAPAIAPLAGLGWLLAQHRFERYRLSPDPQPERVLIVTDVARIEETVRLAQAVALVRDLVDTPASDMGPADLVAAAQQAAAGCGAELTVTDGKALAEGYPMIHAVGRAATADRAPRLIELDWGNPDHPRLAIIGKGVCFDSGGLDIKPSSGMRLMKKDMGGAAHAIALARLVMEARLPVRLHMLVPAVENAVSAASFRPGDILASRNGVTVEIGNTDAEGRLILADALTRALEGEPDLIVDFATLTGAARVALGPDLPALFSNDDSLAADLLAAADASGDPLWRLPLWQPYAEMLKSDLADIGNAADGPFAGAVTAALFLNRFVPDGTPWAHLDTFAWMPAARPGRPRGGEALGLMAVWEMLRRRFG